MNSTITGNVATGKTTGEGGGLRSTGDVKVEVVSSTLSGNTVAGAGSNRGGNVYAAEGKGSIVFRDSIVSAASARPERRTASVR